MLQPLPIKRKDPIFIQVFYKDVDRHFACGETPKGFYVCGGKNLQELRHGIMQHDIQHVRKVQYFMDLTSVLNLFPEFNLEVLARRAGTNASLLRQYKRGLTKPSIKQQKRILTAIHHFAKELLATAIDEP
ncbi:MAG: hypothetical protein ACPGRE_03880 [Flavobacteriaceae bacterium]